MKTFRIIICLALVSGITGLTSCNVKPKSDTVSKKTPNIDELFSELSSSQEVLNAEKDEFVKLLEDPNCDKAKLGNAEMRFSAALKDYYFHVQEIQELDPKGENKAKCDEALRNYEELFKLLEKSSKMREGN